MTLVLTLILLSVAVAAMMWAMALFVQPYLHGEPADRLPIRVLVAGLTVGCFVTFWVYVNTRADRPDKYGTFFEFNPTGTKTFDQFEAVERLATKGADGKYPEKTVAFKRTAGKQGEFVAAGNPSQKFRLNTTSMMTVAIIVDDNGQKARFDAELSDSGTTYKTPAKVFRESGSARFLEGENIGTYFAPSTGSVVAAVTLNLMLFVVWFLVFFPILRYSSGLSLGLAVGFGLATMLIALPLLFEMNRKTVV